jgi:hypothetical protein
MGVETSVMKYLIGAVAVSLCVAGLSCGGHAPAQKESARQQKLAGNANAAGARGSQSTAKANSSPGLNIPKDARFTVFCGTFGGPGHIQQAKGMKERLAAQTGMRDWYTVQGEGQTTLYYGFYRAVNEQVDAKEGTRAQNDRKRIASMTGANGGRLFNSVLLVALDEADPSSPAEWNLENAKGHWTIQIAVYKDHPQRKQYAVDAVRTARGQGYEAYYYHGPTASSVCIGVWPATAAKTDEEIRMTDPNTVPLIAPGSVPVREGIMTPDGRPIHVVRPKTEVLDESLAATLRAFPNHYVNGATQQVRDPQTGQVRTVVEPSLLVRVPQKRVMVAGPGVSGEAVAGDSVSGGNVQRQQGGTEELRAVLPGKTQQGGRLKSLE